MSGVSPTSLWSPSPPSSTPASGSSGRGWAVLGKVGVGVARWLFYHFRIQATRVCSSPDVPASPLSVHDRYSSPAAGSAKRRLFGDDPPSAGVLPSVSPMSSPAKRLTFGSSGTLRIGAQPTQTTVLSIPLQGSVHAHTHAHAHVPGTRENRC